MSRNNSNTFGYVFSLNTFQVRALKWFFPCDAGGKAISIGRAGNGVSERPAFGDLAAIFSRLFGIVRRHAGVRYLAQLWGDVNLASLFRAHGFAGTGGRGQQAGKNDQSHNQKEVNYI